MGPPRGVPRGVPEGSRGSQRDPEEELRSVFKGEVARNNGLRNGFFFNVKGPFHTPPYSALNTVHWRGDHLRGALRARSPVTRCLGSAFNPE